MSPYRQVVDVETRRKYARTLAGIGSIVIGLIAYILALGFAYALSASSPRASAGAVAIAAAIVVFNVDVRLSRGAAVRLCGARLTVAGVWPAINVDVEDLADVSVSDDGLFGGSWENLSFKIVRPRRRRVSVWLLEDARSIADGIARVQTSRRARE